MSNATKKKVKMILVKICLASLVIICGIYLFSPPSFNSLGEDHRFELKQRRIFTMAIEGFFQEKHRLPNTAKELDEFGHYYLKQIIHRDKSLFYQLTGHHWGREHLMNGYGKSYDDFEKYSKNIQIIHSVNYRPQQAQVVVSGCQNKILYQFNKDQNNFLVMTCRNDQLTGGTSFIGDKHKHTFFSHPEKGFRIDHQFISTSGNLYIHQHSQKIISYEFFDSETKAGRIPESDLGNWLEIDYKDLNGNKPKAN